MDSDARVVALEKKLADLSKMVTFRLLGNNPALVYGPPESSTSETVVLTATDISAPVFAEDAGASDTYAGSLSPAITSYVTGTHYRFKAATANTGAATINLNSIGAKTIVKVAGGITTALADNDIRAGQWVDLVYDGTNMQMQSTLGNAAASSGSVVASLTVAAFDTATTTGTVHGSYDVVHLSDGIYTCVWNGSAWEYYYGSIKVTRPPAASGFTQANFTGAAISDSIGGWLLTAPISAGNDARYIYQTAGYPATPYTFTIGFVPTMSYSNAVMGIILGDGTKVLTLHIGTNTGNVNPAGVSAFTWTNASTVAALLGSVCPLALGPGTHYLTLTDNGTNLIGYWSANINKLTHFQVFSTSRTGHMAGGPTRLGIFSSNHGSAACGSVMEVFHLTGI